MSTRVEQLDHLRQEVNLNLAFGAVDDLDLVTNDRGECPVVVALDTEALSVVLGRLRAVGGYGTVFSRGPAGVRVVSMIHDVCAIGAPSDSLIPGPESEFGMFLDDAVCRAAELGLTATQIAPFAGVSRQSVDSMLARHRPA